MDDDTREARMVELEKKIEMLWAAAPKCNMCGQLIEEGACANEYCPRQGIL